MEWRTLGPLAVVDGERDIPIRGAKQRALVALLLVHHGETVHVDRLADELWRDDAPSGTNNAVQVLVSKVRRALGEHSDLLVTGPGGYRLDAAAADIDSARFAEAVDRGRAHLAAGDAAAADGELSGALALWRGPALDGLADEGALRREALRLEEMRAAAIEDWCDAELRLGRHAELVGELEALVAANPLRERLHGFLMLALYRSGRQAEALRAYQAARDVLAGRRRPDDGSSDQASLQPHPMAQHLHRAGGRRRRPRCARRRTPARHRRRPRGRRKDPRGSRRGNGPPRSARHVDGRAGPVDRPGRRLRRRRGRRRPAGHARPRPRARRWSRC